MSDAPIILVGAGGHARVLLDALALAGQRVLGLVDVDVARGGRELLGVRVLGDDDVLRGYEPSAVRLVNAIGSVRSMQERKRVYDTFVGRGYSFASVLHPAATLSPHAVVAPGAQIMAGVVLQAGAAIGLDTIVNTGATIDHDCRIGAHVHVAPGVTLSGDVQVGDESHVGAGATVIQGVRIGARCLIAAGAVVVRDVADGKTVAGLPATEKWR